jgi:RNA-dependent RNA polymerase
LKEGEVFCQFQQDDDHQPRVVVSEVLVCRAPARKLSFSMVTNSS